MGDTNISSHNQKGGITAQNVNTGSGQLNVNQNEGSKEPKNNLWKIISGIIVAIAAIVAILTYLDINPFK